ASGGASIAILRDATALPFRGRVTCLLRRALQRAPWPVAMHTGRRAIRIAARGRAGLASLSQGVQPSVEVKGGADQRQVGKGLGKVSEMVRARTQLLRVETEVV